jgi:2-phospho-L-lactate guanylyltransferase
MLHDVLTAITQCHAFADVMIVTDDVEAARIGEIYGAAIVPDAGHGLNPAVQSAAAFIERERPGSALLMLPADVPHVSAQTLAAAADALRLHHSAVLARAARDGGTNLFGYNPACMLVPQFGPDSFARHLASAEAAGARVTRMEAELTLDLDEPADLHQFQALRSDTRTDALLREWGFATDTNWREAMSHHALVQA